MPVSGRPRSDYAYVYVAHCEGFYKVGIAMDLTSRFSALRGGNPFPVTLAAYRTVLSGSARDIEGAVHQILAESRVRGEWFNCTLDEIRSALKRAISKHEYRRLPPLSDAEITRAKEVQIEWDNLVRNKIDSCNGRGPGVSDVL